MMRPIAAVLALLAASVPAAAQEWVATDARSRALGNAGVALSDGPEATYWNPASLAWGAEKPFDFSTGTGFSIFGFGSASLEGDILGDVNHVIDLYEETDFEAIQQRVNTGAHTPQDIQDAMEILDAILALDDPGKGGLIHAGAGLELKIGPIGLFGRALTTAAIDPFYDFSGVSLTTTDLNTFFGQLADNTVALSAAGASLAADLVACGLNGNSDGGSATDAQELAYQAQLALGDAGISDPEFRAALCEIARATAGASGGNTLYVNPSGVEVRSILQKEVGIAFGLPLFPSVLNVGIALKEIITDSFYRKITFEELDEDDDLEDKIRDEYKENQKRSNDFNIDFGATLTPLPWIALSLSARNLLPMSIDIDGPGGDLELDPMFRAGLSLRPLKWVKLGVDLDLTTDDSDLLRGYESKFFGAGLELDIPVLKLRGGYFENLEGSSGGVVTGGLGIDFYIFRLDIGGQVALDEVVLEPESAEDDEVKVPERASAGITLRVDLPF